MKEVINYYNTYDEDRRLTRKSRLPEYLITMKYIKKYLKPNSKILEIGAGTGRYSIALADMGYEIDAVELVPHNIEIMQKKVKSEHRINIYQGNACDLSFVESESYDIVLLLGPMYHLFNNEDKHKAICEAIRQQKKMQLSLHLIVIMILVCTKCLQNIKCLNSLMTVWLMNHFTQNQYQI